MEDNKQQVKDYFSRNAASWVAEQYTDQDYCYPVGPNRIRIALHAIDKHYGRSGLRVLDIGCGGGAFCVPLLLRGDHITAIDLSAKMLQIARENVQATGRTQNIHFIHGDIESTQLQGERFDVISALGLYEYLDDGNAFLRKVKSLLAPGGIAIIDFRNRLFNMASISAYTEQEITNNTAAKLITEINTLYSAIPTEVAHEFIKTTTRISADIAADVDGSDSSIGTTQQLEPEHVGTVTATQQTPDEVRKLAEACGLTITGYYGVHPHLLVPKLNRLLPPKVFNSLSDALLPFEHLPISLIWSSKFIGVFKK